jgi:WD40 repeat protein
MTLGGHSSPVMALAFAADGRSLASLNARDRTDPRELMVLTWDLSTGQPRHRSARSWFWASAFSSDGRLQAITNPESKQVELWDVETGNQLPRTVGQRDLVRSAALSPDARLLATATGDRFVSLWSVGTGRELRRLDGQTDVIRHVAFSPDGKTLAADGKDGNIHLWNLGGLRDVE